MDMMLFAHIYPEIALAETRSFTTRGHLKLPDDEYAIFEAYCPDPKCNCRRVMLNVVSRRDVEKGKMQYLASISYGFDRDEEFAGPELDILNPQSRYSRALLEIVEQILEDPDYVARLKKHYRMAKKAATSSDPVVREKVARFRAEEEAMLKGSKLVETGVGEKKAGAQPGEKSSKQGLKVEREEETVPKAMRPTFEAVVAITDDFCKKYLDEEYAQLSRKLAAALARKRPSPLAQGKPLMWACGIVYALGSVNFLWDKTQTPHMSAGELCQRFGVGKSGCSAKARSIMDMFRMGQADPRWYRPSKMDENPLAWLISVDGIIVDARTAPRQIQEEALRKGLIPYIPKAKGSRR